MIFTTAAFLAFFPIVVLVYYMMNYRASIWWLLIASCVFYMWLIPNYIFIILGTVLIDYFGALAIERSSQPRYRKLFLWVSILFTCLLLFIFKYYNFFQVNVSAVAQMVGWNYQPEILAILLPVGLSFHTFQSLSYVIEVYERRQTVERNFVTYFLYVMFFPQLVAGPIERPQQLLWQFKSKHEFETSRMASGLRLMVAGFFKKVVIADNLASFVNPIFDNYRQAPRPLLVLAVLLFAFQIYCDFSGYTTIARGAARVLGFELMENFNRPYLSKTVTEFWRRWHISLSSWFRDYVYLPLGGSRKGEWRSNLNLMIVFLVSGLWHGASWNFIVWGGINGLAIVAEKKTRLRFRGQGLLTFAVICLSWIFFRSRTIGDSFEFLGQIFTGPANPQSVGHIQSFLRMYGLSWAGLIAVLLLVLGLLRFEFFEERRPVVRYPTWVFIGLIALTLMFGVFKQEQFIYFQF